MIGNWRSLTNALQAGKRLGAGRIVMLLLIESAALVR